MLVTAKITFGYQSSAREFFLSDGHGKRVGKIDAYYRGEDIQ